MFTQCPPLQWVYVTLKSSIQMENLDFKSGRKQLPKLVVGLLLAGSAVAFYATRNERVNQILQQTEITSTSIDEVSENPRRGKSLVQDSDASSICLQALRVASGFCVAGWLAIYFAQGTVPLDIGRLATGYGMGVFSYVVHVFITEIAPKNLRGALTVANQLMITGLGTFIIDRAGRKPLLMASASGLVLGCLITGLSFYLKTYEIGLKAAHALAVTGILVYIGSFSRGMGSVPWVVMSEIFDINIKGAGGSLATLVNWFGA